jgi:hypothetical protein
VGGGNRAASIAGPEDGCCHAYLGQEHLANRQHDTAGTGAATVETNLLLNTLQAGALAIGDTVRIRAAGTSTSSAGGGHP